MMEEDFKRYTEEQEEKIKALREEAELRSERNRLWMKRLRRIPSPKPIEQGSPVFVRVERKTISGYVMMVNDNNGNLSFDVKTPLGTLGGIPSKDVWERHVTDVSNIKIPEKLKAYSTSNLLHLLRMYRIGENQNLLLIL